MSSLHRIKSDEIWYYHDGRNLEIVEFDEAGKAHITLLGKDLESGAVLQHVVKQADGLERVCHKVQPFA